MLLEIPGPNSEIIANSPQTGAPEAHTKPPRAQGGTVAGAQDIKPKPHSTMQPMDAGVAQIGFQAKNRSGAKNTP